MKDVYYLMPHLKRSGPVNVLYSICVELNRQLFNPIIITLFEEGKSSRIEDFSKLNIQIIQLRYNRIDVLLRPGTIRKSIKKYLANSNYPILHAHCHYPTVLASHISCQKLKTVATIHNICDEDYITRTGWLVAKFLSWQFKKSLCRIDEPVAISNCMKEFYSAYAQNISVIHNGVSVIYNPEQTRFYRGYLLNGSKKRIITVTGHINRLKNTFYILKELKSLERNDYIVFFLGAGDEKEKCMEYAKSDERFVFKGYVNNVNDYLSASDLFISASLTEGLPMAVLEAILMGVPTLLSNIKPHEEIESIMNINSVKTYPLQEGVLAELCSKFLDMPYDKRIISQTAEEHFSAEIMTRHYEQLYG